jgi:hypothetical protein
MRRLLPLPTTSHPEQSQNRGSDPESGLTMRLYRHPHEPQHWLAWTDDLGWSRFPAKIDGWAERCPANVVIRQQLQRVPLRMAFNTGLIESLPARTMAAAA